VRAEAVVVVADAVEDPAAAERHAAALAALDDAIDALERLRDSADWFNSSQWMCVAAEVVALKGMRAMVRGGRRQRSMIYEYLDVSEDPNLGLPRNGDKLARRVRPFFENPLHIFGEVAFRFSSGNSALNLSDQENECLTN